MQRRALLRRVGAAGVAGVAVPGSGCGGLGGTDTPLDGSAAGPYLLRGQEGGLVYVSWTLRGQPEEWPSLTIGPRTIDGFRSGYSRGDGDPKRYDQLVWEGDRLEVLPGGIVQRSSFEDDDMTVHNVVLGRQPDLESGTTFRLQLIDPDSDETYTLSTVTYEGSPEANTPSR